MKGIFAGLACVCLLTSCSVIMAGRKEGVSVNRVQCSRSRADLLACGACILGSDRTPDGQLVEVYQFQKERGSISRAVLHGALDITTGGLWEVIGTPMEACGEQREYFCIRVYYDYDEYIERIELL